jgi:hypothetical protein
MAKAKSSAITPPLIRFISILNPHNICFDEESVVGQLIAMIVPALRYFDFLHFSGKLKLVLDLKNDLCAITMHTGGLVPGHDIVHFKGWKARGLY